VSVSFGTRGCTQLRFTRTRGSSGRSYGVAGAPPGGSRRGETAEVMHLHQLVLGEPMADGKSGSTMLFAAGCRRDKMGGS
jgi:hypothetical protein